MNPGKFAVELLAKIDGCPVNALPAERRIEIQVITSRSACEATVNFQLHIDRERSALGRAGSMYGARPSKPTARSGLRLEANQLQDLGHRNSLTHGPEINARHKYPAHKTEKRKP
jgi:hypothetical protein